MRTTSGLMVQSQISYICKEKEKSIVRIICLENFMTKLRENPVKACLLQEEFKTQFSSILLHYIPRLDN